MTTKTQPKKSHATTETLSNQHQDIRNKGVGDMRSSKKTRLTRKVLDMENARACLSDQHMQLDKQSSCPSRLAIKVKDASPPVHKRPATSYHPINRSQVSACRPNTCDKNCNLRDSNSLNSPRPSSSATSQSRPSSSSASSQSRATKTFTKKPGLETVNSGSALFPVIDVNGKTCSSILKDSKFPKSLELNPGGTESEGTSVKTVCCYAHCSLNSHEHAPAPPLKKFLLARSRMVKNQKNIMQKTAPSFRRKGLGKVKKIDTGQEAPGMLPSASAISALVKELGDDFFVGVSQGNNEDSSEFEESNTYEGDSDNIDHNTLDGISWIEFGEKGTETEMKNQSDECYSFMGSEDNTNQDKDSISEVDEMTGSLGYVNHGSHAESEEAENSSCLLQDYKERNSECCTVNKLGNMNEDLADSETRERVFEAREINWEEETPEHHYGIVYTEIPGSACLLLNSLPGDEDTHEHLPEKPLEERYKMGTDETYGEFFSVERSESKQIQIDDNETGLECIDEASVITADHNSPACVSELEKSSESLQPEPMVKYEQEGNNTPVSAHDDFCRLVSLGPENKMLEETPDASHWQSEGSPRDDIPEVNSKESSKFENHKFDSFELETRENTVTSKENINSPVTDNIEKKNETSSLLEIQLPHQGLSKTVQDIAEKEKKLKVGNSMCEDETNISSLNVTITSIYQSGICSSEYYTNSEKDQSKENSVLVVNQGKFVEEDEKGTIEDNSKPFCHKISQNRDVLLDDINTNSGLGCEGEASSVNLLCSSFINSSDQNLESYELVSPEGHVQEGNENSSSSTNIICSLPNSENDVLFEKTENLLEHAIPKLDKEEVAGNDTENKKSENVETLQNMGAKNENLNPLLCETRMENEKNEIEEKSSLPIIEVDQGLERVLQHISMEDDSNTRSKVGITICDDHMKISSLNLDKMTTFGDQPEICSLEGNKRKKDQSDEYNVIAAKRGFAEEYRRDADENDVNIFTDERHAGKDVLSDSINTNSDVLDETTRDSCLGSEDILGHGIPEETQKQVAENSLEDKKSEIIEPETAQNMELENGSFNIPLMDSAETKNGNNDIEDTCKLLTQLMDQEPTERVQHTNKENDGKADVVEIRIYDEVPKESCLNLNTVTVSNDQPHTCSLEDSNNSEEYQPEEYTVIAVNQGKPVEGYEEDTYEKGVRLFDSDGSTNKDFLQYSIITDTDIFEEMTGAREPKTENLRRYTIALNEEVAGSAFEDKRSKTVQHETVQSMVLDNKNLKNPLSDNNAMKNETNKVEDTSFVLSIQVTDHNHTERACHISEEENGKAEPKIEINHDFRTTSNHQPDTCILESNMLRNDQSEKYIVLAARQGKPAKEHEENVDEKDVKLFITDGWPVNKTILPDSTNISTDILEETTVATDPESEYLPGHNMPKVDNKEVGDNVFKDENFGTVEPETSQNLIARNENLDVSHPSANDNDEVEYTHSLPIFQVSDMDPAQKFQNIQNSLSDETKRPCRSAIVISCNDQSDTCSLKDNKKLEKNHSEEYNAIASNQGKCNDECEANPDESYSILFCSDGSERKDVMPDTIQTNFEILKETTEASALQSEDPLGQATLVLENEEVADDQYKDHKSVHVRPDTTQNTVTSTNNLNTPLGDHNPMNNDNDELEKASSAHKIQVPDEGLTEKVHDIVAEVDDKVQSNIAISICDNAKENMWPLHATAAFFSEDEYDSCILEGNKSEKDHSEEYCVIAANQNNFEKYADHTGGVDDKTLGGKNLKSREVLPDDTYKCLELDCMGKVSDLILLHKSSINVLQQNSENPEINTTEGYDRESNGTLTSRADVFSSLVFLASENDILEERTEAGDQRKSEIEVNKSEYAKHETTQSLEMGNENGKGPLLGGINEMKNVNGEVEGESGLIEIQAQDEDLTEIVKKIGEEDEENAELNIKVSLSDDATKRLFLPQDIITYSSNDQPDTCGLEDNSKEKDSSMCYSVIEAHQSKPMDDYEEDTAESEAKLLSSDISESKESQQDKTDFKSECDFIGEASDIRSTYYSCTDVLDQNSGSRVLGTLEGYEQETNDTRNQSEVTFPRLFFHSSENNKEAMCTSTDKGLAILELDSKDEDSELEGDRSQSIELEIIRHLVSSANLRYPLLSNNNGREYQSDGVEETSSLLEIQFPKDNSEMAQSVHSEEDYFKAELDIEAESDDRNEELKTDIRLHDGMMKILCLQHDALTCSSDDQSNSCSNNGNKKSEKSYSRESSARAINQDEPMEECSNLPETIRKSKTKLNNEDLEKWKTFKRRTARILSKQQNLEPEMVIFRHAMMDERKSTEKWMIDYALRRIITKLTPVRKRKVAMLVEAFETVIPLPPYDLDFAHERAIQSCR